MRRNETNEQRLNRLLLVAQRREDNDDHLEDNERQELVNLFREVNPNVELPEDLTNAYVQVVFD